MSKFKTRLFDMANYLGSEEEIAEYLRQVLEDGDPEELVDALDNIARARGRTHPRHQASHATQPVDAVSSTSSPNAMR